MQLEAGLGEIVMDLVFVLRRLVQGIFLLHKDDFWMFFLLFLWIPLYVESISLLKSN